MLSPESVNGFCFYANAAASHSPDTQQHDQQAIYTILKIKTVTNEQKEEPWKL